MGEVLGIGVTHYPPLLGPPETYANLLRGVVQSPVVPAEMKNPENWPEPMREEYANEEALALEHQERMVGNFRKVREAIDDFAPDAVIIFGDDQYENFKEDIIPPFCVFLHESMESIPFASRPTPNAWGEPSDKVFVHKGDRPLAQRIASRIIERDFPISFAYSNSHYAEEHGPTMLTHAFLNALLFLDWDRRGFDYPVIPIQVNCYGEDVISSKGGSGHLNPDTQDEYFREFKSPPGPTPASCFQLGETLREVLDEMDGRYVVMASSGWSHAFLCAKNDWLYPDIEEDRKRVESLRSGRHADWANLTNAQIHESADQEFKNWICLAGAMSDRKAVIVDYVENYIFNSNKCFAIFPPDSERGG